MSGVDEYDWLADFNAAIDRVHDNPPPAPEGLELVECGNEPRHWPTYLAHVEGMYPAPCLYCAEAATSRALEALRCKHEHHRWQTWRVTAWFARHAYVLGIISGSTTSYNGCAAHPKRTTINWRGKRSYFLGLRREDWACLRRGHRRTEAVGCGLCSICLPCPDCGSTDPAHYVCGGAA